MGAFDYTGGSFFGYKRDPEEDKFEQLTKLRTRYRTPGEETIAEIGEGRGMATLSPLREYSLAFIIHPNAFFPP
jgi:hypothetical protein